MPWAVPMKKVFRDVAPSVGVPRSKVVHPPAPYNISGDACRSDTNHVGPVSSAGLKQPEAKKMVFWK